MKNHFIFDSLKYTEEEVLKEIKNLIILNNASLITIDISSFNFIEATNICIMASTFQFTLNPYAKIKWIVDSNNAKKNINRLKLKNISLEMKNPIVYTHNNLLSC